MPRVLIVEDEKSLNEAYELILKREGYEVETASDGQQAIEVFKKKVPNIVLLDLRMPKLNGVEVLKELDISKNYPKVKVIIFSNYSDQSEIDEAYKLGAHRYILKAWSSPKELVKIVKDTLSKKSKA
jgi:DNA-binding NtrC family response regulator